MEYQLFLPFQILPQQMHGSVVQTPGLLMLLATLLLLQVPYFGAVGVLLGERQVCEVDSETVERDLFVSDAGYFGA